MPQCITVSAAITAANPDKRPSSASSPGYSYDGPAFSGAASTFNRVVASRNPAGSLADSIPGGGVPGQDYPVLASVPDTGFSCASQQLPGYYADTAPQAGCQVFHICQFDGRQDSFLCPNGSIFNQQYFVCDWWFNVDCAASQQFVGLNAEIGKVSAGSFVGSASSLSPSTAYGPPRRAGSSSNGFGQGSANGAAASSNSFSQVSSASSSFSQVASASSSFSQAAAAPSQSYGVPA
ncbi:uncharacterized protein [Macrobrachium rosenbergii]|uniref:uncharacterized protein n=1 Tax=Macrobrachium rosenbergii TaxID=79674 RepID=UPI0034D43624